MGDFNEWRPFAFGTSLLEENFGNTPAPRSYPASWALVSLDRIWVRPPEALRWIGVYRNGAARTASDHLPVVARVDLER
jgi:endonuclease/exonuclease/phosphatase family metal-dependent hydrolase